MQSLVKYFISLLFALLLNLIPTQLAMDQFEEPCAPGVYEIPAALCGEDFRLPGDYQHPYAPEESESQLFALKSSCS